ncbi:hypothetical protein [Streptomyces acidiscabies]|uniref:Uncharacterized protein n=1 Tax=Streptomyces acidiscabies TaxID=42234 RepID=A0ABU4LYI9_9ACTN|nr:hypothetical protein [Streptomyces acidiscabies]MDX3020069.1 hypothetical protein [Streptomyces acidiscabies]
MSFEIYHPNPNKGRRTRGPAKVTVTHAENGRSQITLSVAARDWLGPTPGRSEARWPANQPTMKLVILIDRDARMIKLQRTGDTDTGDHVHDVKGLSGTSAAYITGWRLHEDLDLGEGHFLAELLPDTDDEADIAVRAIVVDAAAGTPIKRRQAAATSDSVTQP